MLFTWVSYQNLIIFQVLFDLPDFRGSKQALLKAYKLGTKNRGEVEKKLRIGEFFSNKIIIYNLCVLFKRNPAINIVLNYKIKIK